MMSRGSSRPSAPGRCPVSIGCATIVRISMISPRLAAFGMVIKARAMLRPHAASGRRLSFGPANRGAGKDCL